MQFHRTRTIQPHGRAGGLCRGLSVEQLTEVFGAPDDALERSDGKVRHEWLIRFENGVRAAIWDYKGGRWSVGGDRGATDLVVATLADGLGLPEDEIRA